MSGAPAIAAKAFAETLEKLDFATSEAVDDPAALGRRAALLAMAEPIWGRALGPLLHAAQVQTLLGVSSRQAVSDLAKRGRLLALGGTGGRKRYPAFQFGTNGRPYPDLAAILERFAGVVETPYTIASWMVSPQPLLEGQTPVAWMKSGRESTTLLEAARRAAAGLAR